MAKLDFSKWAFNRLASVVDFVNTGTDIVGTKVQDALVELADRHFGKNYGFAAVASFRTSSTTAVTAAILTIPNAPAGRYRGGWSWTQSNSKNNTDGVAEIVQDGIEVLKSFEQTGVKVSLINGFQGDINHAVQGDLTIELTLRRSSGNGQAGVSDIKIEVWRIN